MNENTQSILRALGLCRRAGKVTFGVPMICEAMRKGGCGAPVLVLEASDTSDNTHKKLTDKCTYYKVRLVRMECSGDELAHSIGKISACGAVAITDKSMCKLIDKYL